MTALAPLLGGAIPANPLPEREVEVVAAVQEVIDAEIAPLAAEHDEVGRYPTKAVAALKRSGALRLAVPEAHGGTGASHRASLEVQVRLAVVDSAVAQVFKIHDELTREISFHGPEGLMPRLSSAIVDDDTILGLAVAEATRTVAEPLSTTAVAHPDGGYVINGTKIYTTGAAEADLVAVWAFCPTLAEPDNPFLGIICNLVPGDAEGIHVHRDWDALGQRATDSGSITFTDVRTDPDWQASLPGNAPLPQSGCRFAAGFAAVVTGIGIGAVAAARPFVAERSRPWPSSGVDSRAADPLFARQAGELVADLAAAYELTMRGGDLLDAFERGEISRTELAVPIYCAQSVADKAGLAAAEEVFALMGTSSTKREHGYDRWWRNARTLTLHDPIDWKRHDIGRHVLTGWDPPPSIYG